MYEHERSLVQRMTNRPFALIGINSDPPAKAQDALERENITWRSFSNGGSTRGPISQAWGVNALMPAGGELYVASLRGAARFDGREMLAEPARRDFLTPPADPLLRGAAVRTWPALAERWGPVAPIATGRSLEDYRSIVRPLVLARDAWPVRRSATTRASSAPDRRCPGEASRTTSSRAKSFCVPRPWHSAHAPYGELKENMRGDTSPMPPPQYGHAYSRL